MSHSYHQGPEDAVLYDGCDECDDRAANPLEALLALDETNMRRLLERTRSVHGGNDRNDYRSDNEARLGLALYRLLVLIERYPWVTR